jgi:glucose uptake protein
MVLPATYTTALLLTILSMICWGSWANTQKLTKKWRFELFYYDYSLGLMLLMVIAAFTFGSMGEDLGVMDSFAIAGKRQLFYGFVAGLIFNLANILLVGAIAIAGLAVAFPISIGIAMVIGVVGNYMLSRQGNPALLFGGVVIVLAAIVVDAMAYSRHGRERIANAPPVPGRRSSKPGSGKGIAISIVSGILMGSFYPLVEMGKSGDFGLGPYAVAVVFGAGIFLSTFIYNLYFMNLPLAGDPIDVKEYFRGGLNNHLLGIAGGAIWAVGTITNFVASSAPPAVNVGPAISYALGQGATLISALWGLLVWKEFAGASARVRALLFLMIVLFVVGLGMISVAPLL